jgi:hypothetical protein
MMGAMCSEKVRDAGGRGLFLEQEKRRRGRKNKRRYRLA